MKIETKAQLLTAESKPYNVNGNEGISHKARFNIEGEIYEIKATANEIKELSDLTGSEGDLTFDLTSRRERLSLTFVEFRPY